MIHVSTDFVFDGSKSSPYLETDTTQPQGVYALTKRDGNWRCNKPATDISSSGLLGVF
jgi:dTDP-4-dehydrorhamnose reductase